jgi:hypothetical protein
LGIAIDEDTTLSDQDLVVVTSAMRRAAVVCESSSTCADELHYDLSTSLLVDFQRVLTAPAVDLAVANRPGTEARRFAEFDVGASEARCLFAVTEFLPAAGTPPEELDGVVAALKVFPPENEECDIAQVQTIATAFHVDNQIACDGGPTVTLVDDGQLVPDDRADLIVPACPFDLILVRMLDGSIQSAEIRRIRATTSSGYHTIEVDRPASGRYRLVLAPADGGNDLMPWPLVSPPYSFPVSPAAG